MGYQNPSSCAADIGKCLNANMLLIDAAQAYFRRALLLAFPANRTADLPYHAGTASRQEVAEEAAFPDHCVTADLPYHAGTASRQEVAEEVAFRESSHRCFAVSSQHCELSGGCGRGRFSWNHRTAALPYPAGTASRQEVAEEAGFSRIHRLPRPQPPDGGHPPATAQRQPPDGDHQKAGVSKPAGDRD